MGALNYIMKNFKYSLTIELERSALSDLVESLDRNELKILQKYLSTHCCEFCYDSNNHLDGDIIEYIASWERNINWILLGKGKQKNEPILTLIKQCEDEVYVKEAKEKLKYRFEYQSFIEQREILKVFLNSRDEDDRKWAYQMLSDNWDNYFCNQIQKLWETYHEYECSIVVMKYLPEEYVWLNQDVLGQNNYYQLCQRLGNTSYFEIDKSRFENYDDYLYIVAKAKGKVNGNEILYQLFKSIAQMLNTSLHSMDDLYPMLINFNKDGYISTKLIYNVSLTLYRMGDIGYTDEIIYYLEWDKHIQEEFKKEWFEYTIDNPKTSLLDVWNLFCEVAKSHFPMEYSDMIKKEPQNLSIEEYSKKNTSFNTLIDQLGLEQGESPF